MKNSFYIQAAIQLGLIEDSYGYGITDAGITKNGKVVQVITPAIETRAQYLDNLKTIRDSRDPLLKDTDWVGLTDTPPSDLVTELKVYRQQLRDITNQVIEGQPLNVTWPTDPRYPLNPSAA